MREIEKQVRRLVVVKTLCDQRNNRQEEAARLVDFYTSQMASVFSRKSREAGLPVFLPTVYRIYFKIPKYCELNHGISQDCKNWCASQGGFCSPGEMRF